MSKTRSLTLPFGLGQASFWMSVCITLSFAAVHLKALGFSNTELGLVMAVGNILGALLCRKVTITSTRSATGQDWWRS